MIGKIIERLQANEEKIEGWFRERFRIHRPPLYSSVDIRNSHHKIAVVDTNAFPAGFNNLCPKYTEQLTLAFRDYLDRYYPQASKILLLPEVHTRNPYYLDNVKKLTSALEGAGREVRVGTLDPEIRSEQAAVKATKGEVMMHRLERKENKLGTSDFWPDLIVSNNDFSSGVPEILQGLDLPVAPSPQLGWNRRRKHRHFRIMNGLVDEFGALVGIDPWCISTYVSWAGKVDFMDKASREKVAAEVEEQIPYIRAEYSCRGINEEPLVFIKNDAGTYGMAVMTARSGDDVRRAARKTRVKMGTGKGRVPVTEVLIQEGIPTRDCMEDSPMEPVIYMVGDRPVGGFYRLHRERTELENLNVKGMEFHRLCFHQVSERHPESLDDRCEDAASLLLVYGTLGRIAALAMSMELEELEDG